MTNTHPHYLYSDIVNSIKADKAVITAMSGLLDGTIAYSTDTNEFGTYDANSNTWTWLGAGALLFIQDDGVPIGTPNTLNFVGEIVDVSISGTVARVFITGSSGGVTPPPSSFDNFWTSGSAGAYSIRAKNNSTTDAVGDYSFARGINSYASGTISTAEGFGTIATGDQSHAEGSNTSAIGTQSHAEGSSTIAAGDQSHAEGIFTKAYGQTAHAEGLSTVASGTYSFAGGNANHALGTASAALGGRNNRVLGNNSVVLGGSGTVGVADDTVFVPNLNVRFVQTGTPLFNLGADTNGNVVIGTTGTTSVQSNDGWNTDGNIWTFLSADAPSYVVSVNANVTGTIGVGMKTQLTHQSINKNFIVTAIGVTGSTSYLNLYGGTDYTLNVTGTITNPKYSQAKSPFGFPMSPAKWSVTFTDTTQQTQANPTQNTWYNAGSLSVNIPIGVWKVTWKVAVGVSENSAAGNCFGTLSTSNNTESNPNMTGFVTLSATGATAIAMYSCFFVSDIYALTVKTTHYFNIRTTIAGIQNIYFRNDIAGLLFTAECAYL